jgi:hypothetical protein
VVVRKTAEWRFQKGFYYSRKKDRARAMPVLSRTNQLGGERITLFMRDDRSIVEGGKVLFYQDKTEEKRPAKKDTR